MSERQQQYWAGHLYERARAEGLPIGDREIESCCGAENKILAAAREEMAKPDPTIPPLGNEAAA